MPTDSIVLTSTLRVVNLPAREQEFFKSSLTLWDPHKVRGVKRVISIIL